MPDSATRAAVHGMACQVQFSLSMYLYVEPGRAQEGLPRIFRRKTQGGGGGRGSSNRNHRPRAWWWWEWWWWWLKNEKGNKSIWRASFRLRRALVVRFVCWKVLGLIRKSTREIRERKKEKTEPDKKERRNSVFITLTRKGKEKESPFLISFPIDWRTDDKESPV